MPSDYVKGMGQLTSETDQMQDQIAQLARGVADVTAMVQELKAQSDTTTLENGLEILRGEHATWLARLENDRAMDKIELLERLKELGRTVDALAASTGTVEVTAELEAVEAPPEVTISHDMLANGTWRYKTSVTMALGDIAEVASALENADQLGRAEAQRRAEADRLEHPISMGTVKVKPEKVKTQLE